MEPSDHPGSPASRKDVLMCVLLGAVTLFVYLRTVAPSLLEEGDGVELATVSYVLGISHPTGYPLFTLLGYAFTHLVPVGSVVARLNVLSAVLTAAAAPAAYILARQLLVPSFGAALAALTFAFSFSVWTVSTRGDVHGLHALLVALAAALLIRWAGVLDDWQADPNGWRRARSYLTACAFVCGLSITNHITTYLLAPAFFVYLFWAGRPFWSRPKRLLLPVLAFLAPLLLYAYIPLRGGALVSDPALSQDPSGLGFPLYVTLGLVSPHYGTGGLAGFVNLVLGLDYAPDMLAIPWSEAPARLAAVPQILARQLGVAGLALSVFGYLALCLRRPREGVLLALIFVAYSLQVTRATEQNMATFLIPAYLFAAACLGLAAALIMGAIRSLLGGRLLRVGQVVAAGALLALPAAQLSANYAQVDRSADTSVLDYTQRILDSSPPPGAIFMGAGDFITPIRYRQTVDGLRKDLVALHVGFGTQRFLDLVDKAGQNGKPVYIVEVLPEDDRDAGTGRFTAKVSPLPAFGEPRPQFAAYTNIAGQAALLGYDLPSETVRRGQGFQVRFYWKALSDMETDYQFFVRLITPDSRIANLVKRPPVSKWYPTSVWKPGATYWDDVRLPVHAFVEPGIYNLEVAWEQGEEMLPLIREGYQEQAPIVLRQITILP